jgi:mercuric ion binding protein
MIKAKKIFVLVFAAVVSSCSNNSAPIDKVDIEVSLDNLTVADYAIEGMVCAMGCAATIQKEVASLSGVVQSNVNYETGKAHFEFDQAVISEQEIIETIGNIADGQYKINQWIEADSLEEAETEEIDVSEASESSLPSMSLPSFKIPNLLTLLLDQI